MAEHFMKMEYDLKSDAVSGNESTQSTSEGKDKPLASITVKSASKPKKGNVAEEMAFLAIYKSIMLGFEDESNKVKVTSQFIEARMVAEREKSKRTLCRTVAWASGVVVVVLIIVLFHVYLANTPLVLERLSKSLKTLIENM